MGLLRKLFHREPKRGPEWFKLQEHTPGTKGWRDVIEPQGEEPSWEECKQFFQPGLTYRLIAQSLDTGHIRSVWKKYHHEPK